MRTRGLFLSFFVNFYWKLLLGIQETQDILTDNLTDSNKKFIELMKLKNEYFLTIY